MPTLKKRSFDLSKVMEYSRLNPKDARIRTLPGDNWLLAGRKGSGKTTAGKLLTDPLLQLYPDHRLYVFDGKMRDFEQYPGIIRTEDGGLPPKVTGNDRVQVWQPVRIVPEKVEEWLWRVRQDAPCILQIDELLYLCYGPSGSEELNAITKLGRGLPILTIIGTQDLVKIPRGVISQPDHVLRFRLKVRYERYLIDDFMDVEEEAHLPEPDDRFGLWYGHADANEPPRYFQSIQEFLGISKERNF